MKHQLSALFHHRADAFFVKIGAHDGVQGDPVRELIASHDGWRGVFVEPVPYLFERLRANYSDPARFTCVNAAIGAKTATLPFYFIAADAAARSTKPLPLWHDEIGSFDRQHIVKHLEGEMEPFIVSCEVECLSLADLFTRCAVQYIDLLHIDTEGFDYKILSQLDLTRYSTRAVIYEHEHLGQRDRDAAWAFLSSWGYVLSCHGLDTLAVRSYD